ncbi:MAG: hypothetical protein QME64_02560, partial [bacterium]|nr:hypothetical protein [bacterium]
EERLRRRKSDAEESIQLRLKHAKEEAEQMHGYDYIVVNDILDNAVKKVKKLIIAERITCWIPAFAGMTTYWIPAFAGMTTL